MPFAKASRDSGTSGLDSERPAQSPDASRAATAWGPGVPTPYLHRPLLCSCPVPHHPLQSTVPRGVASSQRPAGQALCPPPPGASAAQSRLHKLGPPRAHACGCEKPAVPLKVPV